MAWSISNLNLSLERFTAQCEAGIKISTSKCETMVLNQKRVERPPGVGGWGTAPGGGTQVCWGLVHKWVNNGVKDWQVDWCIIPIMWTQLSNHLQWLQNGTSDQKNKFAVPDGMMWVSSRVDALFLRGRRRGYVVWRSWRGSGIREPTGQLPGNVLCACPTRRTPRGRPETCWRDVPLIWLGNSSVFSHRSWGRWLLPPQPEHG